ncbi:hypothetical protein H5410_031943 [Solanum commersonii]|uniref:Uncharacterized protein n=1 Tax=Solanum commersonii TaxID=4109 RepID=A0A9J5YKP5_SOLCO|nr:hypothetical protein H5410_031943 [Solanum commersonii]
MSVNTFAMEPIGLDGQNDLLSRSNEPTNRLTPHFAIFSCAIVHEFLVIKNSNLWSQLALMAKTTYFQGQTRPTEGKHPFC